MPWYSPNPAPGLAITSAWGNAVENASQPVFATLAAMVAGWPDAPDGASAFSLADRSTFRRRGGAWLRPLENVQGVQVNIAGPIETSGNFVPPANTVGASLGTMGPSSLRGKRVYLVSWRGRFQMSGAGTNKELSIIVNATGTGADVPLGNFIAGNSSFANGQRPIDAAMPFGFSTAVVKQTWSGTLVTGGTDDQVLSVTWQAVLATAGVAFIISETNLTVVDVGAAP